MKSTQSPLSYLIFALFFLMSFQSWAVFVQGTHLLTDVSCNGVGDGAIKLIITSQTSESSFTYAWFKDGTAVTFAAGDVATTFNTGSNIYTTQVIGLEPGMYYAKITGVGSGDQQFTPYLEITQPSAIGLEINESATSNPICYGGTGTITLTAYGGYGTYTYASSIDNATYSYATSNSFTLGIGTYRFSAQTTGTRKAENALVAQTCTYDFGTSITDPLRVEKTLTQPTEVILNSPSAEDISCFGETDGVLKIVGGSSGGTGTRSYGYLDKATLPLITEFSFSETAVAGADVTFSNMGASTHNYYVAVKDQNGCAKVQSTPASIAEPSIIGAITSFTRNNPSGIDAADGSIVASNAPGGGTVTFSTPITYSWVGFDDHDPVNNYTSTDLSPTGLAEATYTLTATDAEGCTRTYAQQNLIDCFDIAENLTNLTSFGSGDGAIVLTALENSSPSYEKFTASWWLGTDDTGTGQDGSAIDGVFTASATVNGAITSKTALVLANNVGAIVSGDLVTGTGIVGTVTVTVIDQNNVTLSAAQTLGDGVNLTFTRAFEDGRLTGVGAGTYYVEVTATGDGTCKRDYTYTLSEPDEFLITSIDQPRRSESQAKVKGAITNATALVLDNNAGTIESGSVVTGTGISGTVTITVIDQNNVTLSAAQTLDDGILLKFTKTKSDIDMACEGATDADIVLTVSGGTAPYSTEYLLPNTSTAEVVSGVSSSPNLVIDNHTGTIEVGDVVTGTAIPANTHVTTVTNQYNLVLSNNPTSNLSADAQLTFTSYVTTTSSAEINQAGWSDQVVAAGGSIILNTQVGLIQVGDVVTGTNIVGNVTVASVVTLTATTTNTITLSSTQTLSDDDVLAFSKYSSVSGLTLTDLIQSSLKENTNRPSGDDQSFAYAVRVKDKNNNYTAISYVDIIGSELQWEIPSTVAGTLGITDIKCSGDDNGRASFTALSGIPISDGNIKWYQYTSGGPTELTDRVGQTSIESLEEGSYSLNMTDEYGCAKSSYFPIVAPEILSLNETITEVSCPDSGNGIITIEIGGGTPNYTYVWSQGDKELDPTSTPSDVTINDISEALVSATINAVTSVVVKEASGDIESGDVVTGPMISGVVTVTGVVGTTITLSSNQSLNADSPLTFTSETNSNAVRSTITSIEASSAGQYKLEITDANGCEANKTSPLGVPQPFVFSATEIDPKCYGSADGTIDLSLVGGTVTTATVVTSSGVDLTVTDQYGEITAGSRVTGTGITTTVTVQTVTDQNTLVLSSAQTLTAGDQLTFTKPAGGYQYSWKKNTVAYATGQDLTSLDNGTYEVSILDGNGCAASETYYMSSPSTSFSIETVVTDATCEDDTDGKINVSLNLDPASLGPHTSSSYTYSWTKDGAAYPEGENERLISDLNAGDYGFTVLDSYGCQQSATYSVADFPLMVLSSKYQNLTCPEVLDASIEIEANGGNGTYAYLWTLDGDEVFPTGDLSSQNPLKLINLDGGDYEVTVSDDPVTSTTLVLTNIPAGVGSLSGATLTLSSALSLEEGDVVTGLKSSATTVTVAAVNSSTEVILSSATESLIAGGTVTFTRALNLKASCTVKELFPIIKIESFAVSDTRIDPLCQDGTDGSISVVVTGGTEGSGYSYQWKKDLSSTPTTYVGNTPEITNLSGDSPSGETYRLVVTDSKNCVSGDFDFLLASPTTSYSINDGRIYVPVTASVNGAVNSPALVTDNHIGIIEVGDSVSGTGITGTVTVLSVTDENNLVLSSSQTLNNDVVLTFTSTASTAAVTANTSISKLLTVNSNIGTIEVGDVVTGGSITGTVTVTAITDQNNLILSSDQSLAAFQNLIFTKNLAATTVSNLTCSGDLNGYINGQLSIDPGHPASYQYTWYEGEDATGLVREVGQKNLTDLGTGNYTLQVEDFYGCIQTNTYEVSEYSSMSVSTAKTDNLCGGDQVATISIEPNGGDSYNYTYQWSRNGIDFEPSDSLWVDKNIFDLISGDYKVIVTDNQGCAINNSFDINRVDPISVTETIVQNICNEGITGAIDVMVTGGNVPYVATWAKVGSYIASIPGLKQNESYGIEALDSGVYTLSVVDRLDCPTFTKDIIVTEPLTSYAIDPIGKSPNCFESEDGEIHLNLTADALHPTDYDIQWFKDGFSYDTEKKDLLNLNGGFFEFTIIDDNGCLRTDTLTLIEPNDIYLHPTIDTLECYNAENGIITLDPTGGSNLYPTIIWKDNGLTSSNIAFESAFLGSGDHSIRLIDTEGCIKDSTIVLDNPGNMAIDTTITDILCKDASTGVINVTMINGKPNYSYAWVADGKVFSTSNTIDRLATGDYFLAVQDDYLCLSDTFTINVAEPNNQYNINGDISRVSCRDSSDAKILVSIEVLGESTQFGYEWEKGDTLISESRDQVDIDPGTYTIAVKDNFGCVRTNTFTVENPDAVQVTSTQENILCYGDSTGLIALSPTGGWGNFSYEWEQNLVSLPISESFGNTLPVGDYNIDVIDDGLCVTPVYITLSAPDTVNFNTISSDLRCYEQKNGSISVSVTGGVPEYTYNWAKDGNPYSQDINLSRLGAGDYELIVTDGSLCEYSSGVIEITEPEVLSLEVLSLKNNLCTTTSNGEFSVIGKGGTGAYLYRLNDGDLFPTSDYDGLTGGNQNIEIIDENLCVLDSTLVVDTDYLIVSDFTWDYEYPYIDWPVSFFDGSLGPDIVNWSWDLGNGALTNEVNSGFTYVSPGSYPITLKITNIVGCEATSTETLNIEKGFRVSMPTAFTPNLDGLNDYFRPTLENIISIQLMVYNKYGSIVFETRDLDGEWDGNLDMVPLPQDSYLYEIIYVAESGVSRTSRGKVAMLR